MPFFRAEIDLCVIPDFKQTVWQDISRHCVCGIEAFEAHLRSKYQVPWFKSPQFLARGTDRPDAVNNVIDKQVTIPALKRALGAEIVLELAAEKEWIPDGQHGRIGRRPVEIQDAHGKKRIPVSFDWKMNQSTTCKLEGFLGVKVYTVECEGVE